MNEYLKETKMLNFKADEISDLISVRGWRELDEFHKIKVTYEFVQNEVLFGYNKNDTLTATEVLADRIGQCNTKATLLMALLRGIEIPCRLRGLEVSKDFQKGATSGIIAVLAPKRIVHTWVEVYYNGNWIALEGVITDKKYLNSLKAKYGGESGKFMRYAVATENLSELSVDWVGKDTFVQREAVVHDYGVFVSPDAFFAKNKQALCKVKEFLYAYIGRKVMTRNVAKIRNRGMMLK